MDLNRYVDELHQELVVAAAAGGDDAAALAERLVAPLQSSVRLVLLDALGAAAAEITSDLAPGSVELRLRGRDPEFVVTPPVAEPGPDEAPAATSAAPPADGDEGGTARITLRLPEGLKQRIEDAAARDGLSVNAWLARTLAGAVDAGAGHPGRATHRTPTAGQRFTGWSRA